MLPEEDRHDEYRQDDGIEQMSIGTAASGPEDAMPGQGTIAATASEEEQKKVSREQLEGALSDALFVLNISLVRANKRNYGLETPCGACPWCDVCESQMPQDGEYCCARAYIAYHIAKREAKLNERVG